MKSLKWFNQWNEMSLTLTKFQFNLTNDNSLMNGSVNLNIKFLNYLFEKMLKITLDSFIHPNESIDSMNSSFFSIILNYSTF